MFFLFNIFVKVLQNITIGFVTQCAKNLKKAKISQAKSNPYYDLQNMLNGTLEESLLRMASLRGKGRLCIGVALTPERTH